VTSFVAKALLPWHFFHQVVRQPAGTVSVGLVCFYSEWLAPSARYKPAKVRKRKGFID
jgi:hypothetical protein